jgi:tetratricopeptide (TPR) repeat protein
MAKNIPSSLSITGQTTLPKRRTPQLSKKNRTRYISRVAVRLSHEAPIPLKDVIDELEKKVIVQVLSEVEGNQKDAAKILGMKYTTLNEKVKRYGIRVKRVSMILLSGLFLCLSFLSMVHASDDLVKKARESLDIMNYQQAVRLLTQAAVEAPKKGGIRVDLAFAFYQSGKTEEALNAVRQERALFPDSYNALILEAYIRFREGDAEGAVSVCRDFDSELFRSIRDKVRIDAGKGKTLPPLPLLERKKYFKKYRSYLKEIQGAHPNFGLPNFILGNHEKTRRNPEKAKKEFQFALETGYDPDACYAQLIDVELTRQDWKQALDRADEAEEVLGPRAEFHFLRGYSHFQTGDTEYAVSCFERVLELKPYLVEAMRNLAKIRLFQGEQQKAIPLLGKILGFRPFDAEAMGLLDQARSGSQPHPGDKRPELTKRIVDDVELEYVYVFERKIDYVLWQVGEYAMGLVRANELGAAADWLSRFIEIYGLTPELNYNLAKIYEQKNDLVKALRYAWRAKELKDDYRDAFDLVGSIFFKMQDFDNALRAYLRALDLNPTDAQAFYNLGCVSFSRGDLENAEAYWKKAIQFEQDVTKAGPERRSSRDELKVSVTVRVRPISFESHKSLGRLYRQQDRKKEALAELGKALELRPNEADLCFEIGSLYLELGQRDRAGAHFERYISLGGDEVKVKKIRQ